MTVVKHTYRQLLLGMCALLIVMAIGRFVYTPMMPFMQHGTNMTNQQASLLASVNYLGYLIGAMIPMWYVFKSKVTDIKIYLILNIVTTIATGLTEDYIIWNILRLISGITSGTVFVLASNVVLEALKLARKGSISGFLYSAVGIGLFLSSIFVFLFTDAKTWSLTWVILGVISLVLGLCVVLFMKENPVIQQNNTHKSSGHEQQSESIKTPTTTLNKKFIGFYYIAYFCEGAGYIITGTFLVSIVKSIPELSNYAALSWMFVGLGAIPSTVVWSIIAEKYGFSKAIYSAFVLQIIGVICPVISHHSLSLIISALLFGGTFLGLTTLFMSQGQTLMYQTTSKTNLVATLTIVYSIGQMIAPSIAGVLIGEGNNYNAALIFATVVLLIGLLCSIISFKIKKRGEV